MNQTSCGALRNFARFNLPLLMLPLLVSACGAIPFDRKLAPSFDTPTSVSIQSYALGDEVSKLLARAHVHIESGSLHEAQAQLSFLLENDPGNAWAMLNLGVVMQRMGMLTRARELYASVAAMPQARLMVAGKISDDATEKTLSDVARHNLRSVNRMLLRERVAREDVLARQTQPALEEANLARLPPKIAVPPAAAEPALASARIEEKKVFLAVFKWREAWMQRRFDDYINIYSPGFAPAGSTNSQWRESRQRRIASAREISIELKGIETQQVANGLVRVRFRQFYRDQRYSDVGCKTLELLEVNGVWQIKSEGFIKLTGTSSDC